MAAISLSYRPTTNNTALMFYMVPTGSHAVINLQVCNVGDGPVTFSFSVSPPQTGMQKHTYLAYKMTLPVGGTWERTGLVLCSKEMLYIQSTSTDVAVRLHGFMEED